ncbi:thioredoxin family protein [Phaeodactylibacter xiamenensis]|uniref:thioredoxin family protein n=1 Tax=Phaeodactylibacter xiamenensis TaxID=1524460 RepID=UPI003CCBC2DC
MALTESKMMRLGTVAPNFSLEDTVTGETVQLGDVESPHGTVIFFLCNHCPYVIHVNPELVRLANAYKKKGIGFAAISSNDAVQYPQDGPEAMKQTAAKVGYPFPYLYDKTQEVAKAYDAACTPDIFVFDGRGRLYYRGRLDGSRPNNDMPLTGEDLRAALDHLLAGDPPPEQQYPSAGCNIKWKN